MQAKEMFEKLGYWLDIDKPDGMVYKKKRG